MSTQTSDQKKIQRLFKLEAQAQRNQMKMDQIQLKWSQLSKEVFELPEWREECQKRGLVTHYNFGDTIC